MDFNSSGSPDINLLDLRDTADRELVDTVNALVRALPGPAGNTLILVKLGIPTPHAGVVLPLAVRTRLTVRTYFDAGPGGHFVRLRRPGGGGRMHRVVFDQVPEPQQSAMAESMGLQRR
jgi:hypothetical protein